MAGCFLVVTAMEYYYLFSGEKRSEGVMLTVIEIILVQGTAFVINKYRDFRALFVGILSAAYVLAGNITGTVAFILFHNRGISLGVQVLIHIVILLFFIGGSRALFLKQQEQIDKGWGFLCVLPALFYGLTYSLSVWPLNIYKNVEVIPAIFLELMLMILTFVFLVHMLAEREENYEEKNKQEYMQIYAERIPNEIDQLMQKEEENAIIRHDLRHYEQMLYTYLQEKEYDKIKGLLERTTVALEHAKPVRYCENISVNSVISYCATMARQLQVRLDMDLHVPAKLKVNEYEYAAVVSNLLENEIRAASEVKGVGKKTVSIKIQRVKEQLVLNISNSYTGKIEFSNRTGLPVSFQPGSGHGYGLKSVQAFAKKDDAVFEYSFQNQFFMVKLIAF
ncbi:MAG: GHKL domain-containing protein [Lachnospiraceae bacterium]|nr:GHKL domain-containing protein [Lachnospiraceae bacterium]